MFLFANIIKWRLNQVMTNQFSKKMKENRTNSRNWDLAGWKISFLLPQKEHKWPNLLKINKLLDGFRIYFRMARNPWEEMILYSTENRDAWYTILSYAHFFNLKKILILPLRLLLYTFIILCKRAQVVLWTSIKVSSMSGII